MSRKAREDSSTWKIPTLFAFVGEYGPFKINGYDPITDNTLIWLCNSNNRNDKNNNDPEDGEKEVHVNNVTYRYSHPMHPMAGDAQELLLKGNFDQLSRFNSIIVIDIAEMFESEDNEDAEDLDGADDNDDEDNDNDESPNKETKEPSYEEIMNQEMEEPELHKHCGKKLVRILQRLLLHNAVIAAQEETMCALLLKCYGALCRIHNDMISEIWLIHPNFSTKYINTHLVHDENSNNTKFGAQLNIVNKPTKKGKNGNGAPLPPAGKNENKKNHQKTKDYNSRANVLDYYFDIGTNITSEATNAFYTIAHRVATDGNDDDDDDNDDNDDDDDDSNTNVNQYDPEYCNNIGKMLFLSLIKVEMNRSSKQYERSCFEITSDLLQIEDLSRNNQRDHVGGGGGETDISKVDWSSCEKKVGALVLRGNKCLLVRSLDDEWDGMRIPSVSPYTTTPPHGETNEEAAVRAVVDYADVEEEEVRVLDYLPPVVMYDIQNGHHGVMVQVYALYVNSPPPEGSIVVGAEEEEDDEEDEEDLYDWYKFPSAMKRLKWDSENYDDSKATSLSTIAVLKTMACHLSQGAQVGLVPNQWGGVFGQEFILEKGTS